LPGWMSAPITFIKTIFHKIVETGVLPICGRIG
jgi:hypothetical protein